MRTLTRKAGAGLLALALGLLTFAHTAMADTASTSGDDQLDLHLHDRTTQRTQNQRRRRSGFTKTGGTNPAIDMRWVKCTDPSVVGTTITNITNDGNQRIWANFIQARASSCSTAAGHRPVERSRAPGRLERELRLSLHRREAAVSGGKGRSRRGHGLLDRSARGAQRAGHPALTLRDASAIDPAGSATSSDHCSWRHS